MRVWYEPRYSGDFRLVADGKEACRLEVEDPTPNEVDILRKFLVKARKKKWMDIAKGIQLKGKTSLCLTTDVATAGKLLMGRKAPKKGTITVVKFEDGSLKGIACEKELAETLEGEKDKKDPDKKPDAAVTTKRPTCCCPECVEGPEVRASQVLAEFCSPEQWEDWQRDGFLICYGNLTGRAYRVAHRESPLGVQQRKPLWDLDDGVLVHCHNNMLPPPEEALSIKLAVEHFEDYVRNQSGMANIEAFDHPFGFGGRDGLADAAFTRSIGRGVRDFFKIIGKG